MSDEGTPHERSQFGALTWTIITEDANLQAALQRVAETGCSQITGCAAASVTIIEGERKVTVGSTSEVAEVLDTAQYAGDDGPCLTAAREQRLVRVHDTAIDERWPTFSSSARSHGVASSLSVPLSLPGDNKFGGFNVYSNAPGGFGEADEELCQAFASQASIVVANAQAYWAVLELSLNLTKAMESRAVIEQAKGMLMSTHRIGADAAFEILRVQSQSSNRKLRDVAAELVNDGIGESSATLDS
jgi:GAF domain-containing protein